MDPGARWDEQLGFRVSGDFGAFIERHREETWREALRATGSPEKSADAVLTAMLWARRQADPYRADLHTADWLRSLVRKAALERIRRVDEPVAENVPEPVVVDHADEVATRVDVEQALSTLPDREREVIAMYMGGFSSVEIAARLGLSQRTVGRFRNNAINRLRKYFESPPTSAQQPGTQRLLAEFIRRNPDAEQDLDGSVSQVNDALERLFLALGPPPDDLVADDKTRRGADD